MSLGLGIFLSALVLAPIFLYAVTRDRWNWKRLFYRTVLGVVGLAVVVGLGFYANALIQDRPRVQAELWDIKLGDTKDDVTFKKGAPEVKSDSGTKWMYKSSQYGNGNYMVQFQNDRVVAVMFVAGDASEMPIIQGVYGSSSLEDIQRRFGPPSLVSTNTDGTSRIVSFRKYNLMFELTKNRVTGPGIFDGSRTKAFGYTSEHKNAESLQ